MEKTKDELYYKICHAVLKLEMQKGRGLWTISDVAKVAQVTRPLIYYYFGKDKQVLLTESWKFMIETMFYLSAKDKLGIRARIKETISRINQMPYLFVLFFLEKSSGSEIGLLIKNAEEKLLKTLKKEYPQYGTEDILQMYVLELGAVAYRDLNELQVNSLFPK